LTESVAPELLFIESKWSPLASYGLTVKAFKDFLPQLRKRGRGEEGTGSLVAISSKKGDGFIFGDAVASYLVVMGP